MVSRVSDVTTSSSFSRLLLFQVRPSDRSFPFNRSNYHSSNTSWRDGGNEFDKLQNNMNVNVPSLRWTAKTLFCLILASVGGRRCCCRAGWIDPDTPDEFHATTSNFAKDTREFELVREVPSFSYLLTLCAFLHD